MEEKVDQLILGLEQLPKPKKIVKSDWTFNLTGMTSVGTAARHVITHIFSQIEQHDSDHIYQVKISDLCEIDKSIDSKKLYHLGRNCARELLEIIFYVGSEKEDTFTGFHLLDTTKKDVACGYKSGVFTARINPIVRDWFLNFKRYVTTETALLFQARSFYTWQFVWALSRWNDPETGKWIVPVEAYQQYMDCHRTFGKGGKEKIVKGASVPKYNSLGTLLLRTTTEALEELKGTKLEFEIGEHILDKTKQGAGRKPITHFVFDLVNITPTKIPQLWWEDKDRARLMRQLTGWGMSEAHIVQSCHYFKKDIYEVVKDISREIYLSERGERLQGEIQNITKFVCGVFKKKREAREQGVDYVKKQGKRLVDKVAKLIKDKKNQ